MECLPSWLPTAGEFKSILEKVSGVEKVAWQISMTSQNNPGSHYSEQNLFEYSSIGQTLPAYPLSLSSRAISICGAPCDN